MNYIASDSRYAFMQYRRSGRSGLKLPADKIGKAQKLNELAKMRGQSLAQMALAWVLRHETMTSVLIGASRVSQIEDAVGMLNNSKFLEEELGEIENILK